MSNNFLEGIHWNGYLRADGKKGIRNKVIVIYTVECASFVARRIAESFNSNDVEYLGFTGCTDNEYAINMLISFCRHPNVGGVLAVGLGCEYVQADRLAEITKKSGRLADYFLIQEVGGTAPAIEKGVAIVKKMVATLSKAEKVPMYPSDLIVGAECGGSDFTSGLAGNMIVGKFFDVLVEAGGVSIFEEILEAVGLRDVLCQRAASKKAEEEIKDTYDKALEYCKSVHQYSISPGNFVGGLSTIEEKSMGAVVKSGSKPIEGVLKVSETPPHKGLWLMDSTPDPHYMEYGISNPNDNEGIMALISNGCQLVFYITGRGNVIGSAIAPVIKITGNTKTFEMMESDMDFNAGRILSGESSVDESLCELGQMVLDVAKGSLTKGEKLGHKEFYIPYKYQEKRVGRRCCE